MKTDRQTRPPSHVDLVHIKHSYETQLKRTEIQRDQFKRERDSYKAQADKLAEALRAIDAALTENELGQIRFGDALNRIREATDNALAEYEASQQ